MPFPENQRLTVRVIEEEKGRIYVMVVEPDVEPQLAEAVIRKTIGSWLNERPQFTFQRIGPFETKDGSLGVNVWYRDRDAPDASSADPDAPAKEREWKITAHEDVLSKLSSEHAGAMVVEAVAHWKSDPTQEGNLAVVFPRGIVVLLNGMRRFGAVLPLETVIPRIPDATRVALAAWLMDPPTRIFAFTIPEPDMEDDDGDDSDDEDYDSDDEDNDDSQDPSS